MLTGGPGIVATVEILSIYYIANLNANDTQTLKVMKGPMHTVLHFTSRLCLQKTILTSSSY